MPRLFTDRIFRLVKNYARNSLQADVIKFTMLHHYNIVLLYLQHGGGNYKKQNDVTVTSGGFCWAEAQIPQFVTTPTFTATYESFHFFILN